MRFILCALIYALLCAACFGIPLFASSLAGRPTHHIRCRYCLELYRPTQICTSARNQSRLCEGEIT